MISHQMPENIIELEGQDSNWRLSADRYVVQFPATVNLQWSGTPPVQGSMGSNPIYLFGTTGGFEDKFDLSTNLNSVTFSEKRLSEDLQGTNNIQVTVTKHTKYRLRELNNGTWARYSNGIDINNEGDVPVILPPGQLPQTGPPLPTPHPQSEIEGETFDFGFMDEDGQISDRAELEKGETIKVGVRLFKYTINSTNIPGLTQDILPTNDWKWIDVTPEITTTYTVSARNNWGRTIDKSITVYVADTTGETFDLALLDIDGTAKETININKGTAVKVGLKIDKYTIEDSNIPGISQDVMQAGVIKWIDITPTTTTTYTVRARNNRGIPITKSVTVNINAYTTPGTNITSTDLKEPDKLMMDQFANRLNSIVTQSGKSVSDIEGSYTNEPLINQQGSIDSKIAEINAMKDPINAKILEYQTYITNTLEPLKAQYTSIWTNMGSRENGIDKENLNSVNSVILSYNQEIERLKELLNVTIPRLIQELQGQSGKANYDYARSMNRIKFNRENALQQEGKVVNTGIQVDTAKTPLSFLEQDKRMFRWNDGSIHYNTEPVDNKNKTALSALS